MPVYMYLSLDACFFVCICMDIDLTKNYPYHVDVHLKVSGTIAVFGMWDYGRGNC